MTEELHPLDIEMREEFSPEQIRKHIEYALSLNLPEFHSSIIRNGGKCLVVGSGPSIEYTIDELKESHKKWPIIAVNGAHEYLYDHGITPNVWLTVDPRPMPQNLVHPNEDTVYLIASRANPETFDALEGCKRVVWHSWSGKEDYDDLLYGKLQIGGGSTSGLRAVNIAYVMGFREVELYGMDCCLGEKGNKRVMDEKFDGQTTDIVINGKTFICNMAMAAQAKDFQLLYKIMPDIHIEVKGEGVLAAILRERKAQKLPT